MIIINSFLKFFNGNEKTQRPPSVEEDSDVRYTLNQKFINEICPDNEAMVYGFQHCHYEEVFDAFRARNIKVYDSTIGNDVLPECKSESQRADGRKIYQINAGLQENNLTEQRELIRICKAALVNIVLENYQSQKMKKPIVPIIFCTDTTNNSFPLSIESVTSRTRTIVEVNGNKPEEEKIITHTELRRAYKLCNDPTINPEIRKIAKQSFKFIEVEQTEIEEKTLINLNLKPIPAPWEAKDWSAQWAIRMSSKQHTQQQKTHSWKTEVNDFVFRQNSSTPIRSKL